VTGDWIIIEGSKGQQGCGSWSSWPERSREIGIEVGAHYITRPRHYLPAAYESVPKEYMTECYVIYRNMASRVRCLVGYIGGWALLWFMLALGNVPDVEWRVGLGGFAFGIVWFN